MSVFVVEEGSLYEGGSVMGVYSTLENAHAWVLSYIAYEEASDPEQDPQDLWRVAEPHTKHREVFRWLQGMSYILTIAKYDLDEDDFYVPSEANAESVQ